MNDSRNPTTRRTDGSDLADFRRLEEIFITLRGAPLLLSPSDWQVAKQWRSEGIPFDLVERVLREMFERTPERRGGAGVRSLKYFDSAVRKAWDEVRALGLGEQSRATAPLDVGSRLRALAAAVPDQPDAMASIRARLLRTDGDAEEIESVLAGLDAEMRAAAAAALEASQRSAIARDVESALARLDDRVSEEDRQTIREQLEARKLRRVANLPVLSLFSPAALGTDHQS